MRGGRFTGFLHCSGEDVAEAHELLRGAAERELGLFGGEEVPVDRMRHVEARSQLGSGTLTAAAVLYIRHLDQMRSFYQQCFGLDAVDTAENYCVLESASWTLSLVRIPDETAATIQVAVPVV